MKPVCPVVVAAVYTHSEAFSMQSKSTVTKEIDLFPNVERVGISTRVSAIDESGRTVALLVESCTSGN